MAAVQIAAKPGAAASPFASLPFRRLDAALRTTEGLCTGTRADLPDRARVRISIAPIEAALRIARASGLAVGDGGPKQALVHAELVFGAVMLETARNESTTPVTARVGIIRLVLRRNANGAVTALGVVVTTGIEGEHFGLDVAGVGVAERFVRFGAARGALDPGQLGIQASRYGSVFGLVGRVSLDGGPRGGLTPCAEKKTGDHGVQFHRCVSVLVV